MSFAQTLNSKFKIILASASPRRKELMELAGLEFDIWPSEKEEVVKSKVPKEICMELSRQKAEDVAASIRTYNESHADLVTPTDMLIIGADTIVALDGNIYTDKGVIAMVWGRIVDADGVVVQNCKYYPYTDSFSLAGTVNAELHFAVLEPGHYAYVVSAIAENNSYSSGEKVLIEHPFEIYYP